MNSIERCCAAIRREMPDRVPVIPLIISHAVKLAGIPFCDYNRDPRIIADCQIAAWRRYGYDGIHVTTDNWILPEALGVQVRFDAYLPPTGLERPLANSRDLARLPAISTAKTAARMPLLPAATRYAREAAGAECFIKTNFDQGPFSLASAVRGIDNFILDLHDDEQFALELLDICAEMVFQLGLAVGQAGAHAVTFGDAVAGLISRKDFLKFAWPFEKRVIERLQAALGIPVFLHICGRTMHILDCMAETGADCLELDYQNDFAEVKRRVGRRTCLEGNLEPSGLLLSGTPEAVYQKSREVIQAAGAGGGLILSSGCEVPRDTPPENIDAMVRAASEF
jgi:uroporphyrinogen decarboxylase